MKKKITLIVLLFLNLIILAQQLPLTNLYTTNINSINPAYSTISKYHSGFLNHRTQWTSLDNNPTTSFLNSNYRFSKSSAIGLNIYSDQQSIINNFYSTINYSRVFKIKKHKLAVGTNIGFLQNKINLGDIIAEDYSDIVLSNDNYNNTTFESELGIIYQFKKFEFGISSPRIIESKTQINGGNYTNNRHLVSYSKYQIDLSSELNITPSVLLRSLPSIDNVLDINADLNWKNLITIGLGARSNNSFLTRAVLSMKKGLEIGYSFESFAGNLSNQKFTSHEIRIGFKIKHKYKDRIDSLIVTTKEGEIVLIYEDDNGIVKHRFINLEALTDFILEKDSTNPFLASLLKNELILDPDLDIINLIEKQKNAIVVEIMDDSGEVKKHKFINLQALEDYKVELREKNFHYLANQLEQYDINDTTNYLKIHKGNGEYQIHYLDESKKVVDKDTVKFDDINNYISTLKTNNPEIGKKLETHIKENSSETIIKLELKDSDFYNLAIADENGQITTHKFITIKRIEELDLNINDKSKISSLIKMKKAENSDIKIFEIDLKTDSSIEEAVIKEENSTDSITIKIVNSAGDEKKFSFVNIEALNEYIIKLKSTNYYLSNQLEKYVSDGIDNIIIKDNINHEYEFLFEDENHQLIEKENVNFDSTETYISTMKKKNYIVGDKLEKALQNDPQNTSIHVKLQKGDYYQLSIKDEKGNIVKHKFLLLEGISDYSISIKDKDPLTAKLITQELDLNQSLKIFEITSKDKIKNNTSNGIKVKHKYQSGDVIKIVYHEFGESKLNINIDDVIQILKDNPWMKLKIEAHTDAIGPEDYNLYLSKKRAGSCQVYLLTKGISTSRVLIEYYGESKPIAPNEINGKDNPEGRSKNRRTEFTVITNKP